MMESIGLLRQDLVVRDLEASSDQAAIEKLAMFLHEKGMVKESYINAIMEREKVFSTGLPTGSIGVAIPHTDVEHVNEPAVAIGILKDPVPFTVMASDDDKVDVKVMFMLAVKEPHAQIELLSTLMGVLSDPELLKTISEAPSNRKVIEAITSVL
jgi:PTS system galactitol-specific IIA component